MTLFVYVCVQILKPADKKKFPYGGLNQGRPVTPPRGNAKAKGKWWYSEAVALCVRVFVYRSWNQQERGSPRWFVLHKTVTPPGGTVQSLMERWNTAPTAKVFHELCSMGEVVSWLATQQTFIQRWRPSFKYVLGSSALARCAWRNNGIATVFSLNSYRNQRWGVDNFPRLECCHLGFKAFSCFMLNWEEKKTPLKLENNKK